MAKVVRVAVLSLVATVFAIGAVGCKHGGKTGADHPQAEHPQGEHPKGDHPKH